MLLLNAILIPLIIVPAAALLRKKYYRDAAIFAAVSIPGYALWYSVASHRPFIVSLFLEKVIRMII